MPDTAITTTNIKDAGGQAKTMTAVGYGGAGSMALKGKNEWDESLGWQVCVFGCMCGMAVDADGVGLKRSCEGELGV